MSTIVIYAITRNHSVYTTTLHTLMLIHSYCMNNNKTIKINFYPDKSKLHNCVKDGDRFVFLDYACSIDADTISKLLGEFPPSVRMLVIPSVLENVDWAQFKKKTLANSDEPANQRGLTFNISVGKEISDEVYEYSDCVQDARVYSLDTKHILKRMKEEDTKFLDETHVLNKMKKLKLKVGVLAKNAVVCHYTYECMGNVLDAMGIRLGP